MNIVFVDNYDSFTYNLVEYVSEHELPDGSRPEIEVLKNTVSLEEIRNADPDAIVVSPGPGHPKNDRDVGISSAVFRALDGAIPTLGVCLGMETAVYEAGGTVGHAPEPVHGKAYPISHDGRGLFRDLPEPFQAGRYHSLSAASIPDPYVQTATTEQDGVTLPMAIRHRSKPIFGVQFHPESVLTGYGHDVIGNFLAIAGGRRRDIAMETSRPD
ncbi:MAG: gamma-glutamyl-gamma-aminobutyrate hydrolase family protein [Halodesulfurarchaeum sp.]